jgi:hypothetical protein
MDFAESLTELMLSLRRKADPESRQALEAQSIQDHHYPHGCSLTQLQGYAAQETHHFQFLEVSESTRFQKWLPGCPKTGVYGQSRSVDGNRLQDARSGDQRHRGWSKPSIHEWFYGVRAKVFRRPGDCVYFDGPDLLACLGPVRSLLWQFDPKATVQDAVESARKNLEDKMAYDIGMGVPVVNRQLS